ncbi:MAG: chromate resistance protein [Chloroflexi bacterium]|nr:chromate resistance protein [Chloroflexota bacterium]
MHVEKLSGMTDQQLIELFRAARKEDYAELEAQLAELEKTAKGDLEAEAHSGVKDALSRLQRQHADIARIDYFSCPEGTGLAARLARFAEALAPEAATRPEIDSADIEAYKDKTWATRPRPHVDRLACAWLIRRYINPKAIIRYALEPEPGEVSFDMNGAHFGHTGNLCTFETMLLAFNLRLPALSRMAEIVHDVDLRDELYARPESAGIDALLKGWLILNLADAELESRGIALFDGLFEHLGSRVFQES